MFSWMPSRSQITSATTILAVIAISTVIATRDRPYRVPVQSVEVTPVEDPGASSVDSQARSGEPPVETAERIETTPGGPAIIKVKPTPRPSDGAIIIRDPSELNQDLRVAHIPDSALIENTEFGRLPKRAEDGRRPFDVYARPWSGTRGARVAIVIGGLGLSQTGTQDAVAKLPSQVTLAFATQGNSIGRWMQTARREGHEILMQVPMEPFDYPNVNPGRNTLEIEDSAERTIEKLRWALARTTNYTGIVNHMGGRYLTNQGALAPVMKELGERGLMFLDDGTSARSIAPELAIPNRVPLAIGDEVIDTARSRGAILNKLDELEATARARGYAVGTGSAFPETVDAVASWVEEVRRKGIEIVPISALATDPER